MKRTARLLSHYAERFKNHVKKSTAGRPVEGFLIRRNLLRIAGAVGSFAYLWFLRPSSPRSDFSLPRRPIGGSSWRRRPTSGWSGRRRCCG